MPFVTVAKDGGRIPVRLTSMLLRDEDQRFRVVTLLPDIGAKGTPATRDVGELRAVSLAAFRAIFGADWERVATRAMLNAEQIIRRRLQLADVVSRSDDHHFVIWFDSADEERNAAILEGAVREIRLRFLTDFGEEVASHVTATIVAGGRTPGRPPAAIEPTLAAPRAMPTRTQFEALLLARRG